MDDESLKQLKKFYNELYLNLKQKKKIKGNHSLLFAFMNMNKSERTDVLNDSTLASFKIPEKDFDSLISRGMIRAVFEINYYAITAKGILEIEKIEKIIADNSIIEFIDTKFFNTEKERKVLKDREKLVIFAMIAIRAFSLKASISLSKKDRVLNAIESLLKDSFDILKKFDMLTTLKKEIVFSEKQASLSPVKNLILHAQDSYVPTRGIFISHGDLRYYLKISENEIVSPYRLGFLLWLIFRDNLSLEVQEEINRFCKESSRNKSIYIFDSDSMIFARPEYNRIIEDAIIEYHKNYNTWEKEIS